MTNDADDLPHPVDRHVGGRVRLRRKLLDRSQDALAEVLGLTFQQVQKYERGANRISASKLYEIAAALEVSVTFFFEGLEDTARDDAAGGRDRALRVSAFLASSEGLDWARAASAIRSEPLRRKVLELARAIAEDDV